jgi:hypothetical protein
VRHEGWSASHDYEHDSGELARAGACYAMAAGTRLHWLHSNYVKAARPHHDPVAGIEPWPFDEDWWKPEDPRRDLVRAGALIIAEIERLDRQDARHEAEARNTEKRQAETRA